MAGFWILLAVAVSVSVQANPAQIFPLDCMTQTVISGDSCGALATRCNITPQKFTQYNPDPNLCSALTPGQRVCCSSGLLPDIRPKSNADGSCASYVIKSGDTCSSIASANGLNVKDLSKFNDKLTWAWSGCQNLMAELAICLKAQNKPPTGTTKLADLNPCPLNSCCNIWGQCGITPEYCTPSVASTGNPGTVNKTGENGCISNCDTTIVNNEHGPLNWLTVGYYESWNYNRSCLNMRVDSIDTTQYTHVHWGFATIGPNFDVSVHDTAGQWPSFTALEGTKKIVSFGGWGFSTDASTYNILRQAMSPANADHFATNIVNFIQANNLDGVDFDWEYPGAPDIPGIPPGLESDAPNYLAFLQILHHKIQADKSISFAAPASYWYLKAFQIKDMANLADYVVFMTYDLHGQWDYGNKFSQEGCPNGNCLRSHVNLTETMYTLAMITKAGVPSNKITVGVSSYGRSFGMTQPGCTGPMCAFGGPESTATPGNCTDAAGYIANAEIEMIASLNDTGTEAWYDKDSNSNIMVYGRNQWVAYMDLDTKTSRTTYYKSLNFAGTVDWAIDLQTFQENDDGNPQNDNADDELPLSQPLTPCTATFATLEDLDAAADSIPGNCQAFYTAATLSNVLNTAVKSYNDMMSNGYDGKFQTYAQSVSDSAGKSVRDFVNGNGTKYFSCLIDETTMCCAQCAGGGGLNPCGYCFDGTCYSSGTGLKRSLPAMDELSRISPNESSHDLVERDHPHPVQTLIVNLIQQSEPCPPDYSKRGFGPDNPYEQSVHWTLLPDKADQFYADLMTNTGIPKDNITLQNYDRGNGCAPSAKSTDPCWGSGMDYSMPTPSGYGPQDVANPKDVVKKALDSANNIQQQLSDVLVTLRLDAYYGDASELVDAISIPVLMIADAVDSMSKVETIADKIDEEKKKALILAFISAILFFIPIAGEFLGPEFAGVAAILAVISAAGDTAMGVYSIVEDPNNPLLGIISIVLAPLALTSLTKISQAANLRRGMSDGDIVKLGGKIGARMQTVQKVIGKCSKL